MNISKELTWQHTGACLWANHRHVFTPWYQCPPKPRTDTARGGGARYFSNTQARIHKNIYLRVISRYNKFQGYVNNVPSILSSTDKALGIVK